MALYSLVESGQYVWPLCFHVHPIMFPCPTHYVSMPDTLCFYVWLWCFHVWPIMFPCLTYYVSMSDTLCFHVWPLCFPGLTHYLFMKRTTKIIFQNDVQVLRETKTKALWNVFSVLCRMGIGSSVVWWIASWFL